MITANETTSARPDLRPLDGHESWRGVCRLLDVDPGIEPGDLDADTRVAAMRTDRTERYRRKHVLGVTS